MVIINLQQSKHRGKKDKNRIEKKANPTESPIEPNRKRQLTNVTRVLWKQYSIPRDTIPSPRSALYCPPSQLLHTWEVPDPGYYCLDPPGPDPLRYSTA